MRLFRSIKNRLILHKIKSLSGEVSYRDEFGNDLLLDLDQYIDARLYAQGSYEGQIIKTVTEIMREKKISTFVDVGANSGFFSLGVSRLLPDVTLWLFEPDPATFERLEVNLNRNQEAYGEKHLFQKAISDKKGELIEFFRSQNPRDFDSAKSNSGTNSLVFNPLRHDTSIKVATARLDDFSIGKPCFIKIDVEGFELEVLKGARALLESCECYILVEALGEKGRAVQKFLESINYKLIDELEEQNFIYHPGISVDKKSTK